MGDLIKKFFQGIFYVPVRKQEMTNLQVELISLLFDDAQPANRKGAVIKAAGSNYTYLGSSTRVKALEENGMGYIFATVYEPDVKDTDGDFMTKDEIRKSMENFNKDGLLMKNDVNHNMNPLEEVSIVESSILKVKDEAHYPGVGIGAWVITVKFEDLNGELWQKAKKGKMNGVSLYGKTLVPDAAAKVAALEKSLTEMISKLEAKGEKAAAEAVKRELEALQKQDSASLDTASIVKAINSLEDTYKKAIANVITDPNKEETVKKIKVHGVEYTVPKWIEKLVSKGFSTDGDPQPMNLLSDGLPSGFIDETIDFIAGTLGDITVGKLGRDNKFDVGSISDMVLYNEDDASVTAVAQSSSTLTMDPQISLGRFTVTQSEAEEYVNSIGRDGFLTYVYNKLRDKLSKAINKLLFRGDRSSVVPALKAMDGLIELASDASDTTTVAGGTYTTWALKFEYALKQFSDDVLEAMGDFVIYVRPADYIDVLAESSQKINVVAGQLTNDGKGNVTFAGIPVRKAHLTEDYFVIGLPKYIICGIRSDADLVSRFDDDTFKWKWTVRIRAAFNYVSGFVKVCNVTGS